MLSERSMTFVKKDAKIILALSVTKWIKSWEHKGTLLAN